jgi:hypothetical protein
MSYAKVILVIGRKRTGKSTFTIQKMLLNRPKVLVVDTYDHPAYRNDFKTISGLNIHNWKSRQRTFDQPVLDTLGTLFSTCFDGVILVEDAHKSLSANIPKSIIQGFVDSRNRGLDVILMFHSLDDVPPYICRMFDRLILFATEDDPSIKLDKFKIRWKKIQPALAAQLQAAEAAEAAGQPSWSVNPKFINFE